MLGHGVKAVKKFMMRMPVDVGEDLSHIRT